MNPTRKNPISLMVSSSIEMIENCLKQQEEEKSKYYNFKFKEDRPELFKDPTSQIVCPQRFKWEKIVYNKTSNENHNKSMEIIKEEFPVVTKVRPEAKSL